MCGEADYEPENVWQSIETVPKDGSPVDLWYPASPRPHDGYLRDAVRVTNAHWNEGAWDGDDFGGDWTIDRADGLAWSALEIMEDRRPTHWMSPPDPPVESGIIRSSISGSDWRKLYALK